MAQLCFFCASGYTDTRNSQPDQLYPDHRYETVDVLDTLPVCNRINFATGSTCNRINLQPDQLVTGSTATGSTESTRSTAGSTCNRINLQPDQLATGSTCNRINLQIFLPPTLPFLAVDGGVPSWVLLASGARRVHRTRLEQREHWGHTAFQKSTWIAPMPADQEPGALAGHRLRSDRPPRPRPQECRGCTGRGCRRGNPPDLSGITAPRAGALGLERRWIRLQMDPDAGGSGCKWIRLQVDPVANGSGCRWIRLQFLKVCLLVEVIRIQLIRLQISCGGVSGYT